MSGQADEQQPGDVEGQAAEADEGQDDGEGAQDAGHPVGVLQLEEESVEAQREEDEGDVGVGKQVQEPLERVHVHSVDRGARPSQGRLAAGHLDDPAIRLGQQVVDGRRP